MGYYGSQMQEATLKSISTLRRASSNSRKAFWLLKSLNHVGSIIKMIEGGITDNSAPLVDKLDFIEHIFLVFYYWYESEIYFARAGLFGLNEDVIDPWCNWTWLGGDVAFLLSGLLRLRHHTQERFHLAQQILAQSQEDGDVVEGDLCVISGIADKAEGVVYRLSGLKGTGSVITDTRLSHTNSPVPSRMREKIILLNELRRMDEETFEKQLSVAIGVLELGVSLHYVDFYKVVFRNHISETYVGAMGVASSVLILYEGLLKARKEMEK